MRQLLLWFSLLVAGSTFVFGFTVEPRHERAADFGDIRVSRVVSVYDGDTFHVDVDGWPAIVGHAMPVRVAGIDCPEMTAHKLSVKTKAVRAKMLTKKLLAGAKVIYLRHMRRGKYFRIIADVELDGKLLSEMLLDAKLAKPYTGEGPRPAWN